MKRMSNSFSMRGLCLILAVGLGVHTAAGVDIVLIPGTLPNQAHPDDPDGSKLMAIVTAAAARWEDIIEQPWTINVTYAWADMNGGMGLCSNPVAVGGKPTNYTITFGTLDASDIKIPWYFDQTPNNHSEFNMQRDLCETFRPRKRPPAIMARPTICSR